MDNDSHKPRIGHARDLARKILKETSIQKPPIILNSVVTHIRQNNTLYIMASDLGEKISGIQMTEGDISAIGYNASQHIHRQRFTVAHELGHLLLGHTSRDSYYDLESKKPYEIEANQFAAELLMPMQMIKQDYTLNKKSPQDLSHLYVVSEEAVWWRLLDCKLI